MNIYFDKTYPRKWRVYYLKSHGTYWDRHFGIWLGVFYISGWINNHQFNIGIGKL